MSVINRTRQISPKRIAGYGLSAFGLLLGFLCLGRAVETALDKESVRQNKRETITVGILLGLPTSVGALWMMSSLEGERRLAYSQRLQALFYKALQANNGRIDAIQFAMLAEVSLGEAQRCLDAWAGPMNADFDIDEAGVVVYCFEL
ncbi:MAG: hypothetical protein AAGB19_05755 [Cyanobacteria bacterium P01_F01_bin.3]